MRNGASFIVSGCVSAVVLAGCSLFVDLSGLAGGADDCQDGECVDASADHGGDAITSDAGDAATGPCPGLHGPQMVLYLGVCIDPTETTKAEYYDFLNAHLPVKTDGPCAFHTTYAPGGGFHGSEDPSTAMNGLDWCDARDYCAWAGKRLCSGVDGGTLSALRTPQNSPSSEWYDVCSQGGLYSYPYGSVASDTPIPGACNLDDLDAAVTPAAPKSFPACEVADSGIFDMLGNVDEWSNVCDEPTLVIDDAGHTLAEAGAVNGICRDVGGVFDNTTSSIICSSINNANRESLNPGVRCCADPL
jgi:formylglycine-generating enzyme required for sulfatase activity